MPGRVKCRSGLRRMALMGAKGPLMPARMDSPKGDQYNSRGFHRQDLSSDMAEERIIRRLAAILATDVAGYARLIEQDEAGTMAALMSRRRAILDPLVARHQGRIFKVMGDGALVEFASAVNAVQCALELQQAFAAANAGLPAERHIVLRIGVHVGDVMVEGSDLYGEGVNIASRLESIAEPGGILVSGTAHDHIGNRINVALEDNGAQTLKNIAQPVRTYRVGDGLASAPVLPHAPSDKPSIAALPFTNMSGDPEQEYFSDGITEDIITELSRFRNLFVIARNSSFSYKGRPVDVKRIGRELGVRYILEGSVRKAGSRLRITGQLIETATGVHLWADRFEGDVQSIFDLQDQVTARVVGAIAPKLEEAEIARVRQKPTESLDAYDCFLRGIAGLNKWSREGNDEALTHFYRAAELDPNYAAAFGLAARTYVQRNACGWMTVQPQDKDEVNRLARRAVELGRDDAVALSTAGFALADIGGSIGDGDAFIDKALSLNPNLAAAWLYSGWVKAQMGDSVAALERLAHAERLSPHDPQEQSIQVAKGFTHFIVGRYGEALACAQSAIRARPTHLIGLCVAAASAALQHQPAEAEKAMAALRALYPDLRLSNVDIIQVMRDEDFVKWIEGLRLAGMPE